MINLSILFILIALAASLAVVYPWLQKKHTLKRDAQRQKDLYGEKLADLENDLAEARIEQAVYDAAKQDLKYQLAGELADTQGTSNYQLNPKLLWLLPVVTIASSFLIYQLLGNPKQIMDFYDAKEKTAEFGQKLLAGGQDFTSEELDKFYLGLRYDLSQNPQPAGWLLLGRVAYSNGRLGDAIQAFEKSLALDENNESTLMSYAQVLTATNDEKYLRKASQTYIQVLQQNPANVEALAMAGYVALQLDDKDSATQYWRFALKGLPENDRRRVMMATAIPELAKEFNIDTGQAGAPVGQGAEENSEQGKNQSAEQTNAAQNQVNQTAQLDASSGNRVFVNLVVSEETKAKLSDFSYLVVFARPALSGPPAAVIRVPISQGIPAQITLSDANAMMPSFNLSSLTSAYITVRLSKDADVMMAQGDIETNSESLTLENQTNVSITL